MRFLTRTEISWVLGSSIAGSVLGVVSVVVSHGDSVLHGASLPVRLLSSVCGWTYFVCWSVSFWPQVLLNSRRKSVDGLSLDFLVLNLVGFAAYTAYNVVLFFPTSVRQWYIDERGEPPGVHANDVVFAVHALVLTAAALMQAAVYTRVQATGPVAQTLKVFPATMAYCVASLVSVSVATLRGPFLFLDVLSAIKVGSSLFKFVPQIIENRRARSTTGFSFAQVVLDAMGSVLSVSQLLLDVVVLNSFGIIRGNPAKMMLGMVSVFYDAVLTYQHITYDEEDLDEPLL